MVQQSLDPPIDVGRNVRLGGADRPVGERRVEDAALARVLDLVDAAPRVLFVDASGEDGAVAALLHVGPGVVDVAVRLRGIKQHAVRTEAEGVAVALVALPDPYVPEAAERVVEGWPFGELCEEGPRVLRKGVKIDAIDGTENILQIESGDMIE